MRCSETAASGAPAGLTGDVVAFLGAMPVARLATADRNGQPHAVPICFVVIGATLYFTVDEKPKRGDPRLLKRLRNITENPQTAVIVDRYDADWSRLGWVMLRGRAEILDEGPEHSRAQRALAERYPAYRGMDLAGLPVVAIRVERVTRWGNLAVTQQACNSQDKDK
jgi:PPOX class probable F420-dependent enzyme